MKDSRVREKLNEFIEGNRFFTKYDLMRAAVCEESCARRRIVERRKDKTLVIVGWTKSGTKNLPIFGKGEIDVPEPPRMPSAVVQARRRQDAAVREKHRLGCKMWRDKKRAAVFVSQLDRSVAAQLFGTVM